MWGQDEARRAGEASPRRDDLRAGLRASGRARVGTNPRRAETRPHGDPRRPRARDDAPRFNLLSNLARADGQTLASLSRSMLVTAGNLTGLVDRAARDGMVERRADPTD